MEGARPGGGPRGRRLPAWLGLLAGVILPAALITTGCENSDPTAPEGSTITVSADPQTIQSGSSATITATVRSANGVRLPDQEVIFSTSAGVLNPSAQTPLTTDDNGQATSILTSTATSTVTAQSGSVSDNTSVNVVNCNLNDILLSVSPTDIQSCTETVSITVTAIDTQGAGCAGLSVRIDKFVPAGSFNELKGSVNPSQGSTGANGEFHATFTPSQNSCEMDCDLNFNPMAPNGGACAIEIGAEDTAGNFPSFTEIITESI